MPATPAASPRALRIPALEYHQVGAHRAPYRVPLGAFVEQLDWLAANGYRTVTLAQTYDYLYAGGDLPPKPVLVTFDDGTADQWEAVGALNARAMQGVFFVPAQGADLSDAHLRQMVAWGHEVEAHS
ncbi:MAG: polysaccharide deacetylase family protein, partial [Actinomycetota bacterium]|nr:polysaccharide deacetylase family protein [Actinomycetota bacterium]